MPNISISEQKLDEAKGLMEQGHVSEGWATIAAAGDIYAANAAMVTGSSPNIMKSFAESMWDSAVGKKGRLEKWDTVAQQHLGNYIEETGFLKSGFPDSQFIEKSYRNTVVNNGLPETVAVDLVFNNVTNITTYDDFMEWQDWVGLEPYRDIPNSTITADLPFSEALALMIKTGTLGSLNYIGDLAEAPVSSALKNLSNWQVGQTRTENYYEVTKSARLELEKRGIGYVTGQQLGSIVNQTLNTFSGPMEKGLINQVSQVQLGAFVADAIEATAPVHAGSPFNVKKEKLEQSIAQSIKNSNTAKHSQDVSYSGPSSDFSPEDSQSAAQNQAQLARNSQLLTERKAQIANAIATINKQDQGLKTIGAVTVQAGDTLTHLAKKYDTSVGALVSVNPQVINADKIYIGDKLNIPTPTTPRKMTPAPLPPRKPTRLVNPGLFGIQDNLSILTAPDKASSITISGIPQGALVTAGSTKQKSSNVSSSSSIQKATAARRQANRKSVESFLGRQNHTVEAKNYAGPSQEYSAEDFQSASLNRAQLNTETAIKSAMNTPSYREPTHPDFQKTRKDVQNAWGRVTERIEQEKRTRQKQERADEQKKAIQAAKKRNAQAQTLAIEEPETLGAQTPSPSTPKQDTLGQKDVLGEATQWAKTRGGLLDNDPTQPSNIDRVMGRMAASRSAKARREKDLSWKDKSWSTMTLAERQKTIQRDNRSRRGIAVGKNRFGWSGDDPSTPGNEAGYASFGGWMGALGAALDSGWYGDPTKNPHTKANATPAAPAPAKEKNSDTSASTRVICTELVRQGRMAPRLQRLDIAYTLKKLSPTTVKGYHFWAVPYVRLMKKSSLATNIIEPFATWRALEIAHQMGDLETPHLRGKLIRLIGEPLCWLLGRVIEILPGDAERFHPFSQVSTKTMS